jgi:hypothetical protein
MAKFWRFPVALVQKSLFMSIPIMWLGTLEFHKLRIDTFV